MADEDKETTREALEAAFDAAVEEAPEETEPEALEPEPQAELALDEPEEEDEPEDPPIAAAAPEDEEPVEPDVEDTPQAPAPDSWKPLAREAWADVPEAAREEIMRRESEIQNKLGELSDTANRARQFEEAVAPYSQTIAMEAGGDAVAATRNLMNVATRLRFGTPQEKAQLVSQIVSQYGVDIEALDSALVGAAPAVQSNTGTTVQYNQPPPGDPRIDQMWNLLNQQQEKQRTTAQQEVEDFLASKEWGNDVRNDMADLMDLSERRGERLTLEQAYDRAVGMRGDLQQIVQSRAEPDAESLRRKKRASKQLHAPAAVNTDNAEPKTLADALNAAWDEAASQ